MTDKKLKVNSAGERELDKAQEQFEAFDNQVKSMTLDHMNMAPKQELEPQTKISQVDMQKSDDIYLKPHRSIASHEKFNEKFRDDYNFAKTYVRIIAENKEIIGEAIDAWVKPFPGCPAEWWKIPVNKAIWVPRYVAERIKGCSYHKLSMQQNTTNGADSYGQYYGSMIVDTTVQRLDAYPANDSRRSIFMGAGNF